MSDIDTFLNGNSQRNTSGRAPTGGSDIQSFLGMNAAPKESSWGEFIKDRGITSPPGGAVNEPGFVSTVKRTGGSMLTSLATTAEDVIGQNRVTDAIRGKGEEIIQHNPAGVTSLKDVVESPWLTVKESLGQFAPQIATSVAGAKAGGAIGSAFGPAGTAAGAAIGGLAPIFVQEYGGIRNEQKEAGKEDKSRALLSAVPATALERVGMGKFLEPIQGIAGLTVKQAAKEVGKGFLREGGTEAAQSVLEQAGAFKNPTEATNLEETALSGIMGGIGGGIMEGGRVAVASRLPDSGPLSRSANAGMDSGAVDAADVLGTPTADRSPEPGEGARMAMDGLSPMTGTPGEQIAAADAARAKATAEAEARNAAMYAERDAVAAARQAYTPEAQGPAPGEGAQMAMAGLTPRTDAPAGQVAGQDAGQAPMPSDNQGLTDGGGGGGSLTRAAGAAGLNPAPTQDAMRMTAADATADVQPTRAPAGEALATAPARADDLAAGRAEALPPADGLGIDAARLAEPATGSPVALANGLAEPGSASLAAPGQSAASSVATAEPTAFNAGVADLIDIAAPNAARGYMVPKDTPGLMPTLESLLKEGIPEVGNDARALAGWLKTTLRSASETRRLWNKIGDQTYRQAAEQAVANQLPAAAGGMAATPAPSMTEAPPAAAPAAQARPAAATTAPIMRRDDLVGAIMRSTGGRGIGPAMAQTLTGDKANNTARLRGLFANGGTQDMDDLAMLLRDEQGYDVRDGAHLEELIREQAAGNPVYSMERTEREAAGNAEREYRDSVNRRAVELGLKPAHGKRTLAMVESDIEREEARLSEIEAKAEREAIILASAADDAARIGMTEADIEAWLSQDLFETYTQEDFDRAEKIRADREDARSAENAFGDARGTAQENHRAGDGDSQAAEEGRGTQEGARSPVEGFDLAQQSNEQAAEDYARQQQPAEDDVTKEQADREREAIPFSLAQESQPRPQGAQGQMFTPDGRAAAGAAQAAPTAGEGQANPGQAKQNKAAMTPTRSANNFAQAREAVANFIGKPITNRQTGMVASLSRNSLDKMLSKSAAQKSSSMKDHLAAVANLDALFAEAVAGWSKRRDSDPSDLKAVHRLFASMRTDHGAVLVKLTVKEMAQQGQNRLYTVESLDVNEASPVPEMVDADRADGSRLLTGPTGLVDSLVREIRLINEGAQPTPPAPAARESNAQAERAAIEAATNYWENERVSGIRDTFEEEYRDQGTVDGKEIDQEGLERDEDGDLTDDGFEELDRRTQSAIDKAVENRAGKIEFLEDIDAYGTHLQALDAARAWMDAADVPYRDIRSAGSSYLEVMVPEGSPADEEGETLKLRFATHANQSRAHSSTDLSWVEGEDVTPLRDMLNAARRFSQGETGLGEKYHYNISEEADDSPESRQFAETERAHGGRVAYDKAKAAGKTKLNFRQWVQVRTPAFKKWFGDWEAARAYRQLTAMDAVPVGDSLAGLDGEALRDAAGAAYQEAAKQGAVTMSDGREVSLTRVGLKKTRSHSADRRVLDLLPSIREVLSKAVPVASLPHTQENAGDSVRAWHYYGAKVNIGSTELYAKLVVRESVNGEIYYDNDLSSVEEIGGRAGDATRTKTRAAAVSADTHSLADLFAGRNEVSKVIDPDTGEPAVVWHYTSEQFDEFDVSKARQSADIPAFFFSTDQNEWRDMGRNAIPAFLNIKNPVEKPDANMRGDEVRQELVSQGYDGTFLTEDGVTEFAAFNPNQIKSATGNTGAFDGANPDIRHKQADRAANLSAADKAIYGMAAEGKSAREVLEFISRGSRTPFNRQLAKLLLKTGIDPTITVGDGKGWKLNAGEGNRYAAGYNPKTDTIALFKPGASERNMLHEMVHAATVKALAKKGVAMVQMRALFRHVSASGKLRGMYGMANLDEFVAESFTNPKFQEALKGVSAPTGGSPMAGAWHWFVRIVRGILGLSSNQDNALSRALDVGVGVMREDMSLRQRAEGASRAATGESAEARQFAETERAHGGRVAYDKAKAAGKTKLNFRQWVQVRTPAFKKWFGDWEAVRAQERLDAMNPVKVRVPDEWRGLSHVELRNRMARELDRMVRERTEIKHPELGTIRVGRVGAKKSEGSARDPAKSLVAADIEALIPSSIHARSETARNGEGPGIDGYSTLLARVSVDGVPLVAAFTVRHQSDGRWYYNAVTLHDGREKAQDSYGRPDPSETGSSVAPIAELDSFIRRQLRRVNPDSVSKVIDPETGEPLVVYHGTGADFGAFDRSMGRRANLGDGFYFAASPEDAAAFAKRSTFNTEGGNVMPVFLNVRNPARGVDTGAEAAGFDGLINGDTYIAFSPEQVKSATGNTGAFDGANPDIRYNVADEAQPAFSGYNEAQRAAASKVFGFRPNPSLRERARGWMDNLEGKLRQGLVDQFAAIKDIDPRAYLLARLSRGSEGTMEAMMLYGRPFLNNGAADVKIDPEGGVAKMLAGLNREQDRFLQWVAAQRAERLKADGRENLLTDGDISALKTLNLGKMANGKSRPAVYSAALKRLNEFNEAVLKLAHESGLIDQAALEIFRDQPYVPFYRLMEGGDLHAPNSGSGLVNQQAFKKLKGGTQQINADLLHNMMMNWSHLFEASAKNRAALATMDAAAEVSAARLAMAGEKNTVRVMRDGKAEHWMIDDPFLLEAVSALHYAPPAFMKPLARLKHLMTWGVTVNPAFKIRNLIRDSLQALALADMNPNVAANLAQGWKLTGKDSQTYASMLAGGGLMKFGSQENSERARAQIKRLGGEVLDKNGWQKLSGQMRSLYDAYQEVGDRTENMNRAALYQRLIDKGHSHAEASFMARDLMDFSMSGAWLVVRFLTQTVPFLNARMQGLYKLGKSAKEDPKWVAIVTGAVALASLALLGMYGDDDDWKRREDHDRDNYWWFKIGDKAFRIPKPFEIGAIASIAERTAEWMFDKEMTGARYLDRMGFMLSQTFALNPIPQAVRPLVDVYANKDDFTGRAIESQAEQNLRPQDRYNERTSEAARWLGQLGLPNPLQLVKGNYTVLSPKQIDYLLRAYLAWVGTVVTTTTDYPMRALAGRGERPDRQLRDAFLVGNFVQSLPAGGSRYVTALYEQSRAAQQTMASYRDALRSGNTNKARSILESEGDMLRKAQAMDRVTGLLSKLNTQAKRIEADANLDGATKRLRLNEIDARRHEAARMALSG